MFPRSHRDHDMDKRRSERFIVNRGLTERMRKSSIPHMQRLLNKHEDKRHMQTSYKLIQGKGAKERTQEGTPEGA